MHTLLEQANELVVKFKKAFKERKKMRALENYSECAPFQHAPYLKLIKRCMQDGFLEEEEAKFLDHMITKYEINYLDWAHKTKWLKQYMMKLTEQHVQEELKGKFVQYDMFDKKAVNSFQVPIELLAQQQKGMTLRK